ncbi:hypothetical protein ColTof4_04495 [Colletotrichum tofieldiae]|nr:hypothetical protein ColTof3_11296 [Colletotrichum tofieldiae]GKT72072.1 hypothetical protein ColTof4_04495 [Colletotrichum tofieldiae]GKT90141.1 hypothetical protein Ct61P_07991 [Colletotrichum tofieldiae]
MEIEREIDQISNHTAEQVKAIRNLIKLNLVTFIYRQYDETRKLISPNYEQHNYEAGDGPESIIEFTNYFYEKCEKTENQVKLEPRIKRILVDGDYIVIHTHLLRWNGDRGMNIMDIYRYKDGQFLEHWDLLGEVPEHCKNANGVF